jgi:uncharacterized protein YsxB (DUF464 family)
MIKVTFLEQPHLTYLKVEGHANFAPHGEDLVCSAVSAVLIGGLNNLHQPEHYQIEIEEGKVIVKELKPTNEHDHIVLETILTSLKTIANDYPKYLQIQRKE